MFSSLHLFLRAKKLIFCSTPSRPPSYIIAQDYITGPFQNPVQERTTDSCDWLIPPTICVLRWEGPDPRTRRLLHTHPSQGSVTKKRSALGWATLSTSYSLSRLFFVKVTYILELTGPHLSTAISHPILQKKLGNVEWLAAGQRAKVCWDPPSLGVLPMDQWWFKKLSHKSCTRMFIAVLCIRVKR